MQYALLSARASPCRLRTAVAMAVLFVVVAGGCLPEQVESGPPTVVLAGWGNPEEVQLAYDIINGFMAENPAYRARFLHIPYNYDLVLLTMMAGGSAPDVFYIGPTMLQSLVSKGVLMNIEERVAQSTVIGLSDYFPQTVSPYRYDGHEFGQGPLYGLCKDWSPDFLVFYNKDLFREAGLDIPDGTWDRETFLDAAKRLTRRDDKGRIIQFGVYNNCDARQWVIQSGGQVYSEDFNRCTLNEPAALEGLQFAADLTLKWRVAPNLAEQAQSAVNVMFETGRVAMCFYGMWFVPQFTKHIKDFEWSVTTPPLHVRDIYLSAGMIGYGISAKTKHPEAAWAFFEYLQGPKGQEQLADIGWNIPASSVVAYGPHFLGNPDHDREIIEVFLEAVKKTVFIQLNPYITQQEFDLYFLPEWDLVLLGERSVKDAMDTVAAKVNQAIADNRALMGK